jgi:multiple sugar transport system ATP-binding protein
MIFDNLALYPTRNGFENLASPLIQKGLSKDEIRKTVFDMAQKLGLTLTLERLPKTMSGGERQRLALGRAMVRKPQFFLLDEPLSSLDAPLRFKLRSELKRLQTQEGHTFLMATPDFHEALAVADEIVMLEQGRVIQIADPQKLYDSPIDKNAAAFVGAPRINLLKAVFDTDQRLLKFAGFKVGPLKPSDYQKALAVNRDLTVGLRPENLRLIAPLVASKELAPPSPFTTKGQTVDLESLGRILALTINSQGQLVTTLADIEALKMAPLGSEVELAIVDPSLLMIFGPDGQNLNFDWNWALS